MLNSIIVLFNLIFFAIGAILLGVGRYIHMNMNGYFDFIESPSMKISIFFIILGIIIMAVSFFACCGTCAENPCMLFTYATFMMVILVAQIAMAISVYIFWGEAHNLLSDSMTQEMQNYNETEGRTLEYNPDLMVTGLNNTALNRTESNLNLNMVMSNLKCCGVDSYKDWRNTTFGEGLHVPTMCCKNQEAGCGDDIFTKMESDIEENIYTNGCLNELELFFKNNLITMAGIAVGLTVSQIVGVVLSCFMATKLNRANDYI